MAVTITNDNFETEVLKSDKPVLVDFWAEWCGPCKGLSPIIEELSEEYADKIKVGKRKKNGVGRVKVQSRRKHNN